MLERGERHHLGKRRRCLEVPGEKTGHPGDGGRESFSENYTHSFTPRGRVCLVLHALDGPFTREGGGLADASGRGGGRKAHEARHRLPDCHCRMVSHRLFLRFSFGNLEIEARAHAI